MTTLDAIAEQATRLPEASRKELLEFARYLEHRGTTDKSTPMGSAEKQRLALAEALEKAVRVNPFADIEDPVAWQKEQRRDRVLPGREEPC